MLGCCYDNMLFRHPHYVLQFSGMKETTNTNNKINYLLGTHMQIMYVM
jgi:hypothetical protein